MLECGNTQLDSRNPQPVLCLYLSAELNEL